MILKITYLKSGRFRDKNDVLRVFVASVSIFWSLKSGVASQTVNFFFFDHMLFEKFLRAT